MGRILRLTFTFIFVFTFIHAKNHANTIIVSPNDAQKSLKQAFLNAEHGDTIIIKPGHYTEGALYLDKKVTIIGEGLPEIDGEHEHENLLVEHDSVVIMGVLFSNSGSSNFNDIAALKIKNSKYVRVENCQFKNNFFGIHAINSNHGSYLNNELIAEKIEGKPSANGIHIWKSDSLVVNDNTIIGHRDGIYLEFVNHSIMKNNKSISNSRYGMHFMFSHDNLFKDNIFKANGAGVAVMYSKRVTMTQNLFTESWGGASYGLLLKEIDDSNIYQNIFESNTIAVYGDGANRIEVKENEFRNNGWAMKMNASSDYAVIEKNNFIANTFDLATNGKLKVNSLNGNYWDKYEGYDLNRDGIGDIPYRPITFYSIIIERNAATLMLFRSFFVKLMDRAEAVFPSLTPEHLKDETPEMRKIKI